MFNKTSQMYLLFRGQNWLQPDQTRKTRSKIKNKYHLSEVNCGPCQRFFRAPLCLLKARMAVFRCLKSRKTSKVTYLGVRLGSPWKVRCEADTELSEGALLCPSSWNSLSLSWKVTQRWLSEEAELDFLNWASLLVIGLHSHPCWPSLGIQESF